MNGERTISINGILYDMHTGMRTDELAPKTVQAAKVRQHPVSAGGVHAHMQHSQTLNRRVVRSQKPVMKSVAAPAKRVVTKSPQITKFASAKPQRPAATGSVISDFGPVSHPITQKIKQQVAKKPHRAATKQATPVNVAAKTQPRPAKQQKEKAIEKALRSAKPIKTKRPPFFKRHPRTLTIAGISLAVLVLAGYFTYSNMPDLSVRLASIQAGVAASYPSYRPDGYSLSGPVAYATGQVSMKFASNAGPQSFTLSQTKSNWDSNAVLSNYVQPKSGGTYNVYNSNGLTIYTFGDNAAWVNGGILYIINGDTSLSNTQLSQLATSM